VFPLFPPKVPFLQAPNFALHAKPVGTVGMGEHGSKSPAKSHILVFPLMFSHGKDRWVRRRWPLSAKKGEDNP
jgi:hypothetical protein